MWRALQRSNPQVKNNYLLDILALFHNNEWNLSSTALEIFSNKNPEEWLHQCGELFFTKNTRNMPELIKLIENNENNSKNIRDKLPKIWKNIQNSNIENLNEKYSYLPKLLSCLKNLTDSPNQLQYLLINKIDQVIKSVKGFNLRDTQKLTVLAMLNNDKHTLVQVSTGEGKSLIVVTVAIIKAILGENVDVITSSSVLAKRDAKENKDIYDHFNITVDHNCEESISKRKEIYSQHKVVYGDLANFQRDYLLTNYYQEKLTTGRTMDNIIIDEVDSMLLDKGNNVLYLSHEIPGLEKLQSVYSFIWEKLNSPFMKSMDWEHCFGTSQIEKEVLYDLYGRVTKEDLKVLDVGLSDEKVKKMWSSLVKLGILGEQGELMMELKDEEKMEQLFSSDFYEYESKLKCFLKNHMIRERHINIPNYLKPFVEIHLKSWIHSAMTALIMQEEKDYVVDEIKTSPSLEYNIVIIDRDTGADQSHSHWDQALHQFLQLKHGCKVNPLSLKAVFISNISYLKLYKKMYGLTGTLGMKIERDILKEIHNVDFLIVPTFKAKQFIEENPILCGDEKEWKEKIKMKTLELIKQDRSVLIICETVNDVKTVEKAFNTTGPILQTYTRDYETFDTIKNKLTTGQIIIATNLAGRGTDINITKELEDAGGLHVCLTYLPKNNRVEQQAFGRTARKDCKGTGQLIIIDSKGAEYGNSMFVKWKGNRDFQEIRRLETARKYYEDIKMEERALEKFYEQYADFKQRLNDNEVKDILLNSCLNRWAFWLDENKQRWIGNLNRKEGGEEGFNGSLTQFLSDLKKLKITDHNLLWVQNPSQILKLGKHFASKKQYDMAVALFDKIIKEEPAFCEAAHYYKAHSLINQKKKDKNAVAVWRKELRQAERLFNQHIKSSTITSGIIDIMKDNDTSTMKIKDFQKQCRNQADVHYKFIESIKNILGDSVTPKHLESYMINEELAEMIHNDLVEGDILKPLRVTKNISEISLKQIAMEYEVSYMKLHDFLSQRKGKKVKKEQFIKELKQKISMPNREEFWKLLKKDALHNEIKYVEIDMEKLKGIDPSLARMLKNDGVNQIQELPEELQGLVKIFLYPEHNNQRNADTVTIEKKEFKSKVGNGKYKTLKNKGILSLNKQAHIDQSKINSSFPILPVFDSITVVDLMSEVHMTCNEAEEIMRDLVDQKILEKVSETYRLLSSYDEIHKIEIHCHSVYQKNIRCLISKCFVYRGALQTLEQMKMSNSSIQTCLMPQTYEKLMGSLLRQRIIKLPTIRKNIYTVENFQSKLNEIYSEVMSQDKFLNIFSQSGLIPAEKCTTDLLNYTIANNLVYIFESYDQKIFEQIFQWLDKKKLIDLKSKETKKWLCNISKIFKGYSITDPQMWIRKFCEYVEKRNQNNNNENSNRVIIISDYQFAKHSKEMEKNGWNSMYQDFKETIECIIKKHLSLSQNDSIEKIAQELHKFRGIIKTSDNLSCNLISLNKVFSCSKFEITQELQMFIANGLSEFLVVEASKWSMLLLLNVTALLIIEVTQLTLGIMMQHYTGHLNTRFSTVLYSQGISDIVYAVKVILTDNFTWSAYKKYKVTSFLQSVGCGMVNESLNGVKNIRLVMEEILTLIAANGAEFLLTKFTHSIIQNIVEHICQKIEPDMDNYDSAILKEVYAKLGKEKGMELVNDVIKECDLNSGWSRIKNVICFPLMDQIKKLKPDRLNKLSIIEIHSILTKLYSIKNVSTLCTDIFQIWEKEMKKRLDMVTQCPLLMDAGSEAKEFEREMIGMWKKAVFQDITEKIEGSLINPLCEFGTRKMMAHINKSEFSSYDKWRCYRKSCDFINSKQTLQKWMQDQSNKSKKDQTYTDMMYEMNIRKLQKKYSDTLSSRKDITWTAIKNNQINETAEIAFPYQNKVYQFNNRNDVDLRENRTLTYEQVRSQVERGIDVTLEKINQFLLDLQNNNEKVTLLKHDDFKMKRGDPVNKIDHRTGKVKVEDYAVQRSTLIRLDTSKQGKLKCYVNIDIHKYNWEKLNGPHIKYHICIINDAVKNNIRKHVGHVLLNKADQ